MATTRRYAGQSADDRRTERRTRLIAAARSLLAAEGLTGITVTAVCAHAELNPRYFYENFTDRDAILDAVFNEIATESAVAIFASVLVAGGDTRQRVRQAYAAAIDVFTNQPGVGQVLADLQTDEAVMRHRAAWTRTIGELAAQNAHMVFGDVEFNDQVGKLVVIYAIGGSLDVLTAWLSKSVDLTRDELIDTCTELLLSNGEALISRVRGSTPGTDEG